MTTPPTSLARVSKYSIVAEEPDTVRIDHETLTLCYEAVYARFPRHAEKAARDCGLDTRAILAKGGRRKMIAGQECMIIDVALDMVAGQAF